MTATAVGCGGEACPGHEPSTSPTAPAIDAFTMLPDAVPSDPWELVFLADFRDGDGDLGKGSGEVFLNGRGDATELQLADTFRQSALTLDATQGRLTIPLRFSDTVHDGDDVRLGLQLVDAAGQRSNCYSLDLHFAVRQLARSLERNARALWARIARPETAADG